MILLPAVFLLVVSSTLAQITNIASFTGGTVKRLDSNGVYFWTSKMSIDCDGSPRCYGPSNRGIDYTANGGRPGNWWGVETDSSGEPIVQGSNDPYPGLYVSTTSLQSNAYSTGVCRNTDSEAVSFIVIPSSSSLRSTLKISSGDFGLIHYKGALAYVTYADAGPSDSIGEASVFASLAVGNNPFDKNNKVTLGISSGVTTIMFPQSGFGSGYVPSNGEINAHARGAFAHFGGCALLAQLGLSVADCSLDKPLLTSKLTSACAKNGITFACGAGGTCASANTCAGWGGARVSGTCKGNSNVVCCSVGPSTRGGASNGDDTPSLPPTAAATLPPGPACAYRGQSGVCNALDTCHSVRPARVHVAASRGATGCQHLPVNIRCCVPSSASLLSDEIDENETSSPSAAASIAHSVASLVALLGVALLV